MNEFRVSTVVYLPPEEVYAFLVDFPRYANYSEHLTRVRSQGDGGPGTRYALRFTWWKLTYTAHSEVTAVDPPTRIDWRLVRDIDADGQWLVDPLEDPPADAPSSVTEACEVHLVVTYDPDTVAEGVIDLPRFISLDWVIDRVTPIIEREAKRVVQRIVADIEGRQRPVSLRIRRGTSDR